MTVLEEEGAWLHLDAHEGEGQKERDRDVVAAHSNQRTVAIWSLAERHHEPNERKDDRERADGDCVFIVCIEVVVLVRGVCSVATGG